MSEKKAIVIDLGTNSIRFDVFSLASGGEFERTYREKKLVRLGEGLFKEGLLSTNAKQRTLDECLHYKKLIAEHNVDEVKAIATSALRVASDGAHFRDELFENTGIYFDIISGAEEAAYIAKGVFSEIASFPEKTMLIDIGGGSTEISIVEKSDILASASLPVGAQRIQQKFLLEHPPKSENIQSAKKHIHTLFNECFNEISNDASIKVAVGTSGTIRAIARLLSPNDSEFDSFSSTDFYEKVEELEKLSLLDLQALENLEVHRAPVILAGAIILQTILEPLEITEVSICESSLRHGIMVQLKEKLKEVKQDL